MKTLKTLTLVSLCAVAAIMATGCAAFEPAVPVTKLDGQIAGQSFSISNPKNTAISNLSVTVATNGTAQLTIGSLTSVNDSNVISAADAGQAAVVSATGDAITKGISSAASAAGQFVGTAAKAP